MKRFGWIPFWIPVLLVALFGCGEDGNVGDVSAPAAPGPAIDDDIEAGLVEIESWVDLEDGAAAFDAANNLVTRLERGVDRGEIRAEGAFETIDLAAQIVSAIDIDVHYGSDEKCNAQHQCVEAKMNCVSLTWHSDDGGGRNCYNFGGTEQTELVR